MKLYPHVLAVVTLGVISTACSSQDDVDSPVGSEPGVPGTLEATVAVSGTRPDPDGYAAVVTLANQSEPQVLRVEPSGGTVRFANLPVGSHSVLLEDLAANCRVLGGNPRSFTIIAGGTSRIEFRVACPGAGTLL